MITDPKSVPEVVLGRSSALPQATQEGGYPPLSLDQESRLRVLLKGAVEDGLIPADAFQAIKIGRAHV